MAMSRLSNGAIKFHQKISLKCNVKLNSHQAGLVFGKNLTAKTIPISRGCYKPNLSVHAAMVYKNRSIRPDIKIKKTNKNQLISNSNV